MKIYETSYNSGGSIYPAHPSYSSFLEDQQVSHLQNKPHNVFHITQQSPHEERHEHPSSKAENDPSLPYYSIRLRIIASNSSSVISAVLHPSGSHSTLYPLLHVGHLGILTQIALTSSLGFTIVENCMRKQPIPYTWPHGSFLGSWHASSSFPSKRHQQYRHVCSSVGRSLSSIANSDKSLGWSFLERINIVRFCCCCCCATCCCAR
jgi:hypothetical protein